MSTAIGVIRRIGLSAFLPFFTERFFTIEEGEPVSRLQFAFVRSQHSTQLQQRGHRSSRVVGAEEFHVFKKLCVVVTRDDDYVLRLARDLSHDVCHPLLTNWRRSGELVRGNRETRRLKLVDNILAGSRQFRRAGRPRAKVQLFADMINGPLAVKSYCPRKRSNRLARRAHGYADVSVVGTRIISRTGDKQ